MGWTKVFDSLPKDPSAEISSDQARVYFKLFNAAFEEAYKKQTSWVVMDPQLRDEIKVSVAKKLVPTYREFYENHRNGMMRACGDEDELGGTPTRLHEGHMVSVVGGNARFVFAVDRRRKTTESGPWCWSDPGTEDEEARLKQGAAEIDDQRWRLGRRWRRSTELLILNWIVMAEKSSRLGSF
ncbi:hypothetical protein ACFX14_045617 [Malus domestica]